MHNILAIKYNFAKLSVNNDKLPLINTPLMKQLIQNDHNT